MTKIISLVLMVVACSAGCGDGHGSDGADAGSSPDATAQPDAGDVATTLADLCNAADGVLVDQLDAVLECNPEIQVLDDIVLTRDDLSALCAGLFRPYVDDATVQLGDAAALAACRSFVDALTCDSAQIGFLGDCADLLVGTVAIDGGCEVDEQCAGNAWCDGGGHLGGEGSCGTCTPTLADGTACVEERSCASGHCARVSADPGICRPYGAAGAPCSSNDDCLGVLRCTSGACAAAPTWNAGTACSEFPDDCGAVLGDLHCDQVAGQCAPYRELGQSCDASGDRCRELAYETCAGGVCVPGSGAGLGEACGFSDGVFCPSGAVCTDNHGALPRPICMTRLSIGEACGAAGTVCGPLQQCNGTCQPGDYLGTCVE